MYSRVTLLEIDTTRVSVATAAQMYVDDVLPRFRAQKGYEGSFVFTTPVGKGMIVTLWGTEDEAAGAAALGTAILEEHVALFRAPPGRDHYEVAVADLPGIALRS